MAVRHVVPMVKLSGGEGTGERAVATDDQSSWERRTASDSAVRLERLVANVSPPSTCGTTDLAEVPVQREANGLNQQRAHEEHPREVLRRPDMTPARSAIAMGKKDEHPEQFLESAPEPEDQARYDKAIEEKADDKRKRSPRKQQTPRSIALLKLGRIAPVRFRLHH